MELGKFIDDVKRNKDDFWIDRQGKLNFRQWSLGNIKKDLRFEELNNYKQR